MIETATRMPPSSKEETISETAISETTISGAAATSDTSVDLEARLYITQSPFYSPAFNGAIFDGPIRLYFSQSQEALALKVYFELRSKAQDRGDLWPRSGGPSLYVMIYPTEETFDLCFVSQGLAWTPDTLPMGRLGRDHVVALQANECEATLSSVIDKVVKVIDGIAPRR